MKDRKARIIAVFFSLTLPIFIFLNVWQVFHHRQVRAEIASLEAEQREWLENNKRVLAGITVLSSPERIDKIAKDLALEQGPEEKVLYIFFDGNKKGDEDG